jgi:methionyl-tRNA synthetase
VFSTPPTPNGDLHLGHLSGPYLGADAFVRFQRLLGETAWHLTGSDDFQSYVVTRALRDGTSPAETAALYAAEIGETLRLMDIQVDQYTTTSSDSDYQRGLQDFFSRLLKSGHVKPQEGPALFDAVSGEYVYEVDVSGDCPTCQAETGGNICEECGEPNLCVDLLAPLARGATPQLGSVTRYTIPLHEFGEEVAAHHHLGRTPARLRRLAERIFERKSFDLPVSHPSSWGVAPVAPDLPGQVVWVWPEMSYGFLYGIQALGHRLGRDWRADAPQPDWKIVHFFGYDNSFYHAILYPTLYRLAFPEWEPDIDYHVNEFLLLDGAKFSTSRQHAIWGKEILKTNDVDAVRYYLAKIRPEDQRTNFTYAGFEVEVRGMLLNGWQQWLHDLGERVDRLYQGTAPDAGTWTPEQTAFFAQLGRRLAAVSGALAADGFSLNQAVSELDGIVADSRRFSAREQHVSELGVWGSETRSAIALELAAAKLLSVCAAPVMPRFATTLAAALGMAPMAAWPETVTLVTAGSQVTLAKTTFFRPPHHGGLDAWPG